MTVLLAGLPYVVAVGLILAAGPIPVPGDPRIARWGLWQVVPLGATTATVTVLHLWPAPLGMATADIVAGTFAIYIALWALCQAALLLHARNRLHARLVDAEIRRLRTQINPHFLYNTLNAISELGYNDPDTADRVITQLSGLLRKSLDGSNQQEVSLESELAFLRSYFDIQKILFRDRLETELAVDDAARLARLPGMILQPLVENALIHGINRSGVSHIRVSAARQGERLVLAVEDDGPGLAEIPPPAPRGLGVSNVLSRLKHLYGNTARLDLRNRPEGGLIAQLSIPFHEMAGSP